MPSYQIGTLIGRGGVRITKIEGVSKVIIQIIHLAGSDIRFLQGQRPILVVGNRSSIRNARQRMEAIILARFGTLEEGSKSES